MKFRAISIAAAIASLTWASAALANGSSASGYGGTAGAVQSQVSSAPHVAAAKGSTLPFTGLNLTLIVVGAIVLLAIGFGLRRFSGDKA
jgi:hypothetical protein